MRDRRHRRRPARATRRALERHHRHRRHAIRPGVARAARRSRWPDARAPPRDAPGTLVAGSTWPPTRRSLPGVSVARATIPDLRLIIAPHEPSVQRWQHRRGQRARREHAGAPRRAGRGRRRRRADRSRRRRRLYALADVAHVGGGGPTPPASPASNRPRSIPVVGPPARGAGTWRCSRARGGGAAVATAELRAAFEWMRGCARREASECARPV